MTGKLVCLALALVSTAGCANKVAARAPAPAEARDEYRGSLYATEYGLKNLVDGCEEMAGDMVKAGRTREAYALANDCDDTVTAVRDDMVESIESLEAWSIAPQHTACLISERMRRVAPHYSHLRNVVMPGSDTIDDGYARAEWLASRCQ